MLDSFGSFENSDRLSVTAGKELLFIIDFSQKKPIFPFFSIFFQQHFYLNKTSVK